MRFVVDGELRASADQLVATLRLFDARERRQLQTEQRAVARARLADAHEELVRQATSATRVMYYEAVTKAPASVNDRTTSREEFFERIEKVRIPDEVGQAKEFRRLADEALRRDPGLAIALAFRADANVSLLWNDYDFTGDRERLLAEADADSLRAITLDDRNPIAWNMRGRVLAARGDLAAALEANDHARQLDPTRYVILVGRGWINVLGGRDADALKIVDTLRGPLSSDSSTWLTLACAAHVQLGDYDSATGECERAVSGTDGWLVYANLAAAHAMRGDMDKAARARAKLLAAAPSFTISRYEGKRYYIGAEAAARDREHMIAGLRKAGVPE